MPKAGGSSSAEMEGNDPGTIIRDLRDRIDALEQALVHEGKRPD